MTERNVTFVFPFEKLEIWQLAHGARGGAVADAIRTLVVEDEARIRFFIKETLERNKKK